MPIYEYECTKCGEHIEKRQSVSDEPLKICEKCGGGLEKKISLSGFQFKGAGWYVTDYSKKNGGKGESKGSESSSAGESTSAAESASKPISESTSKAEKPAAKE